MQEMKDQLLKAAREWGADLFAVADTARLEGLETRPPNLLEGFPRAVSMAVRLSDGVMDDVVEGPTELYAQHYEKVNALLDSIALRVAGFLQAQGGRAKPIPASQILCEKRFVSYISHKAVAIAAGLGWQGKSLLLVTRAFGPRVRLVTVLTDVLLPPDEPIKNFCGKCTSCADACPAGAIRGMGTKLHFSSRREAVDLDACVAQLNRHSQVEHIKPYICGVCVSSCPWGKKRKRTGAKKA